MERFVQREWLDELPPEDPRAVGSRRDLRRVNAWMGNASLLERLLTPALARRPLPRRFLELGSGDGTLLLKLARRLAPRWPGVEVVLLDQQPLVTAATLAAFEHLGWKARVLTCDVLEGLDQVQEADAVLANLFLHHFQGESLNRLLEKSSRAAPVFAACEPRRSRRALFGCRLLRLIGCNEVTRHDAVVSVQAGFSGTELSQLWPAGPWEKWEGATGLFSHVFAAHRPAR